MSTDVLNEAAQGRFRSLIERYERNEASKAELDEVSKEILAEVKSSGFDKAVFQRVLKARKKDTAQRSEEEAIFDLYMAACA